MDSVGNKVIAQQARAGTGCRTLRSGRRLTIDTRMRKRMPFRFAILLRRPRRDASGQRTAAAGVPWCGSKRSRKAISLITTVRRSRELVAVRPGRQTDPRWMNDRTNATTSTASGQISDYIPTTKQYVNTHDPTRGKILSRSLIFLLCRTAHVEALSEAAARPSVCLSLPFF